MGKMTIWDIDEAIAEAWESALDMETGEILDENAFDKIDALNMERDKKIENAIFLVKNKEALVEGLKKNKADIDARMKSERKQIESLKRYLEKATMGEKWDRSDKVSIKWRKSQEVVIQDGAFLPDEYVKYSEPTPDKMAIKKALKEGIQIDGAVLVDKKNIQIV